MLGNNNCNDSTIVVLIEFDDKTVPNSLESVIISLTL